MPRVSGLISFVAVASLLLGIAPVRAEPALELIDGGRTLVYRAREGDTPSAVARALGIPAEELNAFLAKNGITDSTKIPLGFVYRVPNPLASQAEAASARAAQLDKDARAARQKLDASERALHTAQAQVAIGEAQLERLNLLETRWQLATWGLMLLAVTAVGAVTFALAALRKESAAQRYLRALSQELEEKRRVSLAERQHYGRRIVELEERIRHLELEAQRRVRTIGRSA